MCYYTKLYKREPSSFSTSWFYFCIAFSQTHNNSYHTRCGGVAVTFLFDFKEKSQFMSACLQKNNIFLIFNIFILRLPLFCLIVLLLSRHNHPRLSLTFVLYQNEVFHRFHLCFQKFLFCNKR